jgi:hypothetical protein
MGVIDETAQWAVSVYQIEAGDPTIGGPDAPDNVQARALADRTLYLKGEIETLEATVAAIDLSGYLETADLLDAITAVDGAGSGLDADTLDGLQASQFLRSDANDTITATLTANQLDAAFVTGGGDELFVAAGDFAEHAEGNLLSEVLYLAGDAGVKAITSSDNLASGWAGRHEATLLDTQGNTHFPGRVYIAGGQTWFRIQRSPNTLHLNTLGTAISVSILLGEGQHFEIWDGIAYTRQYTGDRETDSGAFLGEITIPNGWGWRLVGGSAVQAWELR